MALSQSHPDIEINGTMIEAHVRAFRLFPSKALTFLAKQGIGTLGADGEIAIDYDRWYPMDAWLVAFDEIAEVVGPAKVFDIARHIPEHARLPPDVKDIHASIRAVDVGYHLNHRKNGEPMFDLATGKMTEGIGHYGYEPIAGERRIISVCENPYSCAFDRGILVAFARKLEPKADVGDVDGAPCRSKGGRSCTYAITW